MVSNVHHFVTITGVVRLPTSFGVFLDVNERRILLRYSDTSASRRRFVGGKTVALDARRSFAGAVPRRQHEEDDGEEKVGTRPMRVTPIAPPQAAPDEESRLYPVGTAAAKRIHARAECVARRAVMDDRCADHCGKANRST